MYVERVVSFNDGWSILTTQKRKEWREAQSALSFINDEFIIGSAAQAEDEFLENGFIPYYMYNMYNDFLSSNFDWPEALQTAKSTVRSQMKPKAIKNGVSVSMIEAEAMGTEDFLTSFYVTIPYYYNTGSIEVSVLLVPTTDALSHIISLGIKPDYVLSLPTESECRAALAKFGPVTSQAPIVLAFFSPTPTENIIIEETIPLKVGGHTIERTIEFAPEYYQASVGLLSYFGEILRQKDPATKAKVRIEQEGNRVRLHIELPGGDVEIIEKQLEQYALVVSRQAEPETLLANRAHIMQLETQLDIARIQVKQAQDLMQLAEGQYTQRINNLERQLEFLQMQFAAQILQTSQVINLATKQNDSHERLQTALLTHSDKLFQDLLQEASGNQRLAEAVSSLQNNLLSGIATIDIEDKLEEALATIKETKPGFLGRILKELEGAAYKASASSTVTWVATWIAAHAQ